MKIFVISLPTSHARRASAASQLHKFGLDFEFFQGVFGSHVLDRYFDGYDEEQFLRNTGRMMCDGEIGCYASHLALWKKCVELDEPIVIMEDDFLLLDAFPESIRQLDRNVHQYGYIRLQEEGRARKLKEKECGNFVLWRFTKAPHGAMCYGISPSVAAVFIEQSNILTAPIDVYVKKFWSHNQPIYGLSPYMVIDSNLCRDTNIKGRKKHKKSLRVQFLRIVTKCDWFFSRLYFNFTQYCLNHRRLHRKRNVNESARLG